MKLNQLRNILAIAERGSLRAAARHLGLAQPALSRSLQELEHELGVQLFERRARGMTVTPMGEMLVRRAGNVMMEVRRAREEIEQLNGSTGGGVTVAMSMIAHIAIMPQILRPFRASYPNVELRIVEGLYPMVESGLRGGSVDFYVGPPPESGLAPELSAEKVLDNRRAIFCRKGHSLAAARSLADLVDAEWLTTSITYNAREELDALFLRHGLPPPKLALHSQSALTMTISLANSDLLAMLPRQWSTFPLTIDTLVSIDIGETLPAPPTSIIRRTCYPLTPAAEFLLNLVRRQKRSSASSHAIRRGGAGASGLTSRQ
jgi:DNA-binding transcriptional LysR family regulator